ncbi:MAG: chorismate synthase [Firmicutes bacterium]|nr:chorismate synthase [Bacillota bacterium]
MRFLTAGESHGQGLIGIIEGIPAGLSLSEEDINRDLARRQQGYGRGGRMRIEKDTVRIVSGVRWGKTLGSPIGLEVANRDWHNWQEVMSVSNPASPPKSGEVTRPRPGHADLAGMLKYRTGDARNILERASARETAMRVAVGAVARRLLEHFAIEVLSHVTQIGLVKAKELPDNWRRLKEVTEGSPVRCADPKAAQAMIEEIEAAKTAGDSLGGVFQVVAWPVPAGLGSHVHWDRRLDGQLAQALMSIPAIKAVEVGIGVEAASLPGSQVHDEIFYDPGSEEGNEESQGAKRSDAFYWQDRFWLTAGGFYRRTNRSGGIEGGISNGSPIVVQAAMKPIPTLYEPLYSVDLRTLEPVAAGVERSDVCAVPATAVVGEAMVAWVLASAFLEKFGGDSLEEIEERYRSHLVSLYPGSLPHP